MSFMNEGRIWMRPGETLTISSEKTKLQVDDGKPARKEFTLTATKASGMTRIKTIATDFDQLLFHSSSGSSWSEAVKPGDPILIELIIQEPQADDAFCSNDPNHPVSGSEPTCSLCGGRIFRSQG